MSGYVIVIPARLESVRLPDKVLADIQGRTMLEHVWRAASRSAATEVVVATDSERVAEAVRAFGGEAVMTSRDHASGSDRIAECAVLKNWSGDQLIVNLQGDEPEMPPACLDQVAGLLAENGEQSADVATLCCRIASADEVRDPNAVKVVWSQNTGQAHYFSRAVVPYPRGYDSIEAALENGMSWYRHIGLYCYRLASLERFSRHAPTPLEISERLEQLRFMEMGGRIRVAEAARPIPPGIDTPEDLERARNRIK